MAYTRSELHLALRTILAVPDGHEIPGGPPYACHQAAAVCWIDKRPEDRHSEILREALVDLKSFGYFRYA